MKIGKLLVASTVAVALNMLAGAANAVTVTIAFQEAGENGGAITTIATAVNGVAVAATNYGTFTTNVVTGQSSPPNVFGNLLSSTASNTSSTAAGTLTIYITAQNITGPIGPLSFTSSLTQNGLPDGWTVTETTLLSTTNQLFTGTTLSTNLFNSIGTFVGNVAADAGAGPYSVTEIYTIVATAGGGDALSTIRLSAVPGPIVGAGLPGLALIMACGSLLALARRRRQAVI